MTLVIRGLSPQQEDKKLLIFFGTKLISVLEEQYFSLMGPMSAIAHGSNTVVTATFNLHKNVCNIHFETHYTYC
jgi:hypothetical protein